MREGGIRGGRERKKDRGEEKEGRQAEDERLSLVCITI